MFSGPTISMKRSRCFTPCASPTGAWRRWATRRSGPGWSKRRSRKRSEPALRAGPRGQRSRADRWTLVACVLASSLSFVEGSVLSVALPAIRASYGADAQQVQWVVNAYLLPLSALLLLGGALGDHFGRKRLLVIGTSIFAVTSLVCALAPSLPILLAARAAQGIGAALLLPNSLALLNAAFQGEKRGRAVGHLGRVGRGDGGGRAADRRLAGRHRRLAGDLLHQPAARLGRDPACAYGSLPRAASPARAAPIMPARCSRPAGSADLPTRLHCGPRRATSPTAHWSRSPSGAVMLAAFLWVEHRRGHRAMMPLTLFENMCFSGLNLLTFLLYGAFGAAMLLIPYVLITSGGYSPVQAGLAMLPLPVLMTTISPTMGGLAARLGPRIPLTIGPLVVAAGMLLLVPDGAGHRLLDRSVSDHPGDGGRDDDRGRSADLFGPGFGRGTARRFGVRPQQRGCAHRRTDRDRIARRRCWRARAARCSPAFTRR